jgi:hypothetical protein
MPLAEAAVPPEQPQPRRLPVTQHQPAGPASRRPAACADCARLARLGEPPMAPADVLAGKVALYFLYSSYSQSRHTTFSLDGSGLSIIGDPSSL